MMKCKVCGGPSEKNFEAQILQRYSAKYYLCADCGFLQSETPHWLPEANRDPLNTCDTGVLSRNLYLSRLTSVVLYFLYGKKARCLDYSGGYGILTRMMRDIGFDSYWCDPNAENIFARGFEYRDSIGDIDLVTCFEAYEHFVEPIVEIEKILKISRNILFTTVLLPDPVPDPDNWWYYGFPHGQHISFYSIRSLRHIAKTFNLDFHTNGVNIHMFSERSIHPWQLWILLFLNRIGFPIFIRLLMKSRTMEDMDILSTSRGAS